MSIVLQGHTLNQRQLDAIMPVMNDMMHGKVSQKKFEGACVKALEHAGCPLGYDTGIPGSESTVAERAAAWIANGRVGMSSRAIWSHMMGAKADRMEAPSDPDDLNRCLLLLDLIPEWSERIPEMAQHGSRWKALAERWDEITDAFIGEVGLDWCNGRSAPITYRLMKEALGEDNSPGWKIRLNP